MEIAESRQGAVTVLKPSGPLCLGDAEQFRRHVADVQGKSLGRLVIDASAIAYVDSQGLEALVAASDELAGGGRALRLCGAGDTLREVLDLTGLNDRFELYDDVNTAVRSFLS
ncbi:MAG: STAS domain-containing protein [Phycisphaerales bacterium]